MPKMIELIRESAVPANIMRTAARGALVLPAEEMIEILVHLSHHPVFGTQARMTLAGWDEKSAEAVAADPNTPQEVLDYLIAPENRRPALVPALLDNPAIDEQVLVNMAMTASNELATLMLASQRIRTSGDAIGTLKSNPNLDATNARLAQEAIAQLTLDKPWPHEDDVLALDALASFETEHKDEIAAEEKKPFQLFLPEGEEPDELAKLVPHAHKAAHPAKPEERERISTLQKIARLTVGERVQLAMKGTKDERFILIRDGSKVVCLAVLESPKLTDSEVEGFAAMKNVQEIVLRTIASKRRFMKHYLVIKQLVNNPRTPMDVSLSLLSHLLVQDLKYLSLNKNVGDTVRKLAYKLHKEKQSTRKP